MKIHNSIPNTLHDNLLTFRDTGRIFEKKGDLLKMITNKNNNVDHASLSDKKLLYDSAKEVKFDFRYPGKKSTGDRILIKLPKSSGLMVLASVVSNIVFLSTEPNELSDRLKLLLQEKQAGKNFDLINQENVTIVDK